MSFATWLVWGAGAGLGFCIAFTGVRMLSDFLQGMFFDKEKDEP